MEKKIDRRKWVKRSTFQKLAEENKRMLADIEALVMGGNSFEALDVHMKWEKHFTERATFNTALKEAARAFFDKDSNRNISGNPSELYCSESPKVEKATGKEK